MSSLVLYALFSAITVLTTAAVAHLRPATSEVRVLTKAGEDHIRQIRKG